MSKKLEDIVIGARTGNESDISLLVEYFENDLLRFCLLLTRDIYTAQDISQDTFVRVIEKIRQLEDATKVRSWIFRTAKNIFLDSLKKASNKNELQVPDTIEVESGGLLDNEEAIVHISRVLSDLSHEDQVVILLSDLEKYELGEVAEMMGKSKGAVKSQLHRAREHFLLRFNDNRTSGQGEFVCIKEVLKK